MNISTNASDYSPHKTARRCRSHETMNRPCGCHATALMMDECSLLRTFSIFAEFASQMYTAPSFPPAHTYAQSGERVALMVSVVILKSGWLYVWITRFSLNSINFNVSSREHAKSNCLSRLMDSDVIAAWNCSSHRGVSLRESQNRIFLSKWPLIKFPDESSATKSWHFEPAKSVLTHCRCWRSHAFKVLSWLPEAIEVAVMNFAQNTFAPWPVNVWRKRWSAKPQTLQAKSSEQPRIKLAWKETNISRNVDLNIEKNN